MSDGDSNVVYRSFRIRKDVVDVLQKAARASEQTVNSLVNEILDKFVNYDFPRMGVRISHMTDTYLTFLTENIPKDKLVEFAKSYALDSVVSGDLMKESSEEELIKFMKNNCKYNKIKLVETTEKSKRDILLYHDIGENHSYFLGSFYKSLFDAIGVKVEFSCTRKAVAFHFA